MLRKVKYLPDRQNNYSKVIGKPNLSHTVWFKCVKTAFYKATLAFEPYATRRVRTIPCITRVSSWTKKCVWLNSLACTIHLDQVCQWSKHIKTKRENIVQTGQVQEKELERLQKLYVEPSQTQYNVSERFEPSNAYSASSFSRRSLPGLGVAQDILSRMLQGNAPSIHSLSRCLAQWLQLLCWLVLMLKPTVLKSNMVSHTMAITV